MSNEKLAVVDTFEYDLNHSNNSYKNRDPKYTTVYMYHDEGRGDSISDWGVVYDDTIDTYNIVTPSQEIARKWTAHKYRQDSVFKTVSDTVNKLMNYNPHRRGVRSVVITCPFCGSRERHEHSFQCTNCTIRIRESPYSHDYDSVTVSCKGGDEFAMLKDPRYYLLGSGQQVDRYKARLDTLAAPLISFTYSVHTVLESVGLECVETPTLIGNSTYITRAIRDGAVELEQ